MSDESDGGKDILVEDEPKLEKPSSEHASEAEVEELVHEEPVEVHGVPVIAVPVAVHHPVLPDPIELAAPAWALGVEHAEMNSNAKTKCIFCDSLIGKPAVRFKYFTHKSQFRYMHPACFKSIPEDRVAHSRATLTYQRHFGLPGAHMLELAKAIDDALSL